MYKEKISQEENEILTRVGPGTPMGELMRQYWIPAMLSSELPEPDCPPVRVMLLCEKLIAFRDSNGQAALIEEACPHRRASLFFGHNKDGGLRCAFHGWKFDVNGNCVDIPADLSQKFKHKIKARTYPCKERGGVVWTYMGPRENPPPLPDLASNSENHIGQPTFSEGNWLQHLETDLDFHHLYHLHKGIIDQVKKAMPVPKTIEWLHRSASHLTEVVDTEVGCTFGVSEEINAQGDRCWGIGHFMFPFHAMLPMNQLEHRWSICRVPIDDYNTMSFGFIHSSFVSEEVRKMFPQLEEQFLGPKPTHLPATSDWHGRHRLISNSSNDFRIDRELQNQPATNGSFNGIRGQSIQDLAIAWSMGPISDRTKEHLTPDDLMIARVRRRLLNAVKALAEEQQTPPGVDQPAAYRKKHGSFTISPQADWYEAFQEKNNTDS